MLHFPNSCLDVPRSTVIKLWHGKPSLGSCQVQSALIILDNFILNKLWFNKTGVQLWRYSSWNCTRAVSSYALLPCMWGTVQSQTCDLRCFCEAQNLRDECECGEVRLVLWFFVWSLYVGKGLHHLWIHSCMCNPWLFKQDFKVIWQSKPKTSLTSWVAVAQQVERVVH